MEMIFIVLDTPKQGDALEVSNRATLNIESILLGDPDGWTECGPESRLQLKVEKHPDKDLYRVSIRCKAR